MSIAAPLTADALRTAKATACCAHCGLPLGIGRNRMPAPPTVPMASAERPSEEPRFCCAGCEAVWRSLHECGLGSFYELQAAEQSHANRPSASAHRWLDHDSFAAKHVVIKADIATCELRVDGIKCGACLWLLEALPRLHAGLRGSRVDIGRGTITLEWLPSITSLSAIADRIASVGYGVRPIGNLSDRAAWRAQDQRWLIDLGVAAAISGNVMAIAFALYGAQFAWMDDSTRQFLQWTSVALAALSVLWPGRIYLRNALLALRTRVPHMDLPIAIALLAGLCGGVIMTALGRSAVYLESVSMLVFLLLVGRFIEFRRQRHARHELELMCALVPKWAKRVRADGGSDEVPVDALQAGDVVRVAAGDALPADGLLLSSHARIDRQLLTGESVPVKTSCGDEVLAGMRTIGSPIEMRITRAGDATRAARIAELVDRAARERAPIVLFANRIAGWFTLAVVAVAAITGALWWRIDPSRALEVVIAMLVVTCPCALGLATPLTMVASLGKAARAGLLIRSGAVIERLAQPGSIVLDKTGTVTTGQMSVVERFGEEHFLQLAAKVEQCSAHPIARAIAALGGVSDEATEVRETPGQGIRGWINGREIIVGKPAFVAAAAPRTHPAAMQWIAAVRARCLTPVAIAVDGQMECVLGVGDPIRSEASGLVRQLTARGWRVWLLSGDDPATVGRAAATIGIPPSRTLGGRSPEQKLELVRQLERKPVIMVGDGLNDLAAMAGADVGVAVQQGAHATLDLADVTLTGSGLRQLVALVDGSARSMHIIHLQFGISLAYNLLGGSLAALGLISPLIAAILMPLSGLTVTAVALRMPKFAPSEPRIGRPSGKRQSAAGKGAR